MSVSGELLCSFELLKPLDSSALKVHIKKGRNMRNSMLNSPVSTQSRTSASCNAHTTNRVHRDNLRKVSRPQLFGYWVEVVGSPKLRSGFKRRGKSWSHLYSGLHLSGAFLCHVYILFRRHWDRDERIARMTMRRPTSPVKRKREA